MRLRLPRDQATHLEGSLRSAGERETGGQIFGEQLAPSDFRATDCVVQKRKGSFARFIVDLVQAAKDSFAFFEKTQHRYEQFNYIGEWHSHPSFALWPSSVDFSTMKMLSTSKAFRGTFAVLLIVKLDSGECLQGRAWVFDRRGDVAPVDFEVER